MSSKRVFFALWPDDRQRDRLRDVINSVAKDVEGRATDRRNWHITLAYVGNIDEVLIPKLLQQAAAIQVAPFQLGFDRLEFWARSKVACLVSPTIPPELQTLVADLHAVLMDAGILLEDLTYRPHLTVSKGARAFTTERLSPRATTEWSSFELIESISGPGGSSYRPLKQ